MPSCFALTKKGDAERASLMDVDVAICNHMGVPVDTEQWAYHWYNNIGLSLAVGHDWDRIREIFKDHPETVKIAQFLEDNYNVDSWKEWK